MMKILLVNTFYNEAKYKIVKQVPSIGDRICANYHPAPKVNDILWYPDEYTLKQCAIFAESDVEAIVFYGNKL